MKGIFSFLSFWDMFYKTATDSICSNFYLYFFTCLNENLPLPRYSTSSMEIFFKGLSDFLGISTEVVIFDNL